MRRLAFPGLLVLVPIAAMTAAFGVSGSGAAARQHTAAAIGVIAYSDGAAPGTMSRLRLLNVDGGVSRPLASRRFAHNASWSPDGTRLVVEDYGARASGAPKLAVISLRAGSIRRITHASALDESPDWSPSGDRIVFSRAPLAGRDDGLWVMSATGGGERHLTYSRFGDTCAIWSPDGRQIAFARYRKSGTRDLWLMRADGKGQHRIVMRASCAAWSPDGTRMAIGKLTGRTIGPCGCPATDLYLTNGGGGNGQLLIRNGGHPSWSPDGTRIVFFRWQGTRAHLWLINADGTGLRRLTGGPHSQWAPDWQPAPG